MPRQRFSLVASVVAVSIWVAANAAQQQQSPPPAPDPNRQVFRLGVELVQVDAVVTDARGRHVTGLRQVGDAADDVPQRAEGERRSCCCPTASRWRMTTSPG